jgi:hypothetical protein
VTGGERASSTSMVVGIVIRLVVAFVLLVLVFSSSLHRQAGVGESSSSIYIIPQFLFISRWIVQNCTIQRLIKRNGGSIWLRSYSYVLSSPEVVFWPRPAGCVICELKALFGCTTEGSTRSSGRRRGTS